MLLRWCHTKRFRSVGVITCASHAQGPRFNFRAESLLNLWLYNAWVYRVTANFNKQMWPCCLVFVNKQQSEQSTIYVYANQPTDLVDWFGKVVVWTTVWSPMYTIWWSSPSLNSPLFCVKMVKSLYLYITIWNCYFYLNKILFILLWLQ